MRGAAAGTHRTALLHREGGVLARDGGELEVHVAPVLPAAGKRRGRARADQSSRGPPGGLAFPFASVSSLLRVSASVVPSDDELFVGDVERARDVTVVGELHEPRDDRHLRFRSPRRLVPCRRRGSEWRAASAGSRVVVENFAGGISMSVLSRIRWRICGNHGLIAE